MDIKTIEKSNKTALYPALKFVTLSWFWFLRVQEYRLKLGFSMLAEMLLWKCIAPSKNNENTVPITGGSVGWAAILHNNCYNCRWWSVGRWEEL